MLRNVVRAAAVALPLLGANAAAQTSGVQPGAPAATLPTTEVIGTTPLPGLGIDPDKVPSNVQSLPAPDTAERGPAALGSELDQKLGSVNINENQDNPFQPDLQYRGFEASPVLGTPAGVAVYQNGIRLNEPFGDNLNWDLIPDFAVNRTSIIPANPLYGLNALGGALVLDMKNGFNAPGGEAELSGGSFGRRQVLAQYGGQAGDFAAYIGGNAYNDDGFRAFSSSQVRQLYTDLGAEGTQGSIHVNFTAARNILSGIGPTPIQLVDVNRNAVFTSPQTFDNTLLMPAAQANYSVTDTLSLQSEAYLREATRTVVNGNTTDAQPCVDPALLCLNDDVTPLIGANGAQVPSSVFGGGIPGELDDSSINSLGIGGSLQATDTAELFGHGNNLVGGASVDHAHVHFTSTNELGTIDPASLVVSGTGAIIDQPDGSLSPVNLETANTYYGLYASDTLDVTQRLSVTFGGRYNVALIHLMDQSGTALNGDNRFSRFNPALGATYKVMPNLTTYFGYAESNRAPTAGEIACSNPAKPCSLDNFLTSDPPGLKQVVAHTYEAGLRGRFDADLVDPAGKAEWNLGIFRTDLADDIFNVPSANINTGYFENIGATRRQGIESAIRYHDGQWRVSASYSLIDATFQSPIALSSPSNPHADASGNIQVLPGDRLPGIPRHRVKLDADYAINARWSVGGDVIAESGQFFFGDESNQNAKLGGYYVINIRSSYQATENVELFVLIENLTDNKYATYGILGDATQIPLPGVANPSDPRFVSVGPPFAAYGGVRVTF